MVSRRVKDGIRRKRRIDLRSSRGVCSCKPLRHHAHHGKRDIGNGQLTPNHVGGTIKPGLPELLGDHHRKARRAAASLIVFRGQISSQQRRRFERSEKLPADRHPWNIFVCRSSTHLHEVRVVSENIRKDVMPTLQAAEEGSTESIVGLRSTLLHAQHYQLLAMRHRERSQQEPVDQGEDCGIRSYTQRQGQERNGRETGRLSQQP